VPHGPALICYDGSEAGHRVILAAAALLAPRAAVVLDVTQPPVAEDREVAFVVPSGDNFHRRLADVHRLAHRGTQLARGHGLDARGLVAVAGSIRAGIIQAAEEVDASVIVMGSDTFGDGPTPAVPGRPLLIVS